MADRYPATALHILATGIQSASTSFRRLTAWRGAGIAIAVILIVASVGNTTPAPQSAGTVIRMDSARVLNHITRWMTGSCIEDVNHEIYGGLYAQMVFGESFEEPPREIVPGWTAYGGEWRRVGDTVLVQPDAGAKLVRNGMPVQDGSVECDVMIQDAAGENAGLIVRVQEPRTGADSWTGYEISLDTRSQTVILGRHRNNWQLLRTAPAAVAPGRWHHLRVDMNSPRLRIFVDGAASPSIDYTDTAAPILSGSVGVRTWNSRAAFRTVRVNGGPSLLETGSPGAGPISGMWDGFTTGTARARYRWGSAATPARAASFPPPPNSRHCQGMTLLSGTGTVGIANRGLNRWGMSFRRGHEYAGSLYLRQEGYTGRVTVALQSASGSRTYARTTLGPVGGRWQRLGFGLRSTGADPNGRLAIWLDRPGTVWVDQVYLSPTGQDLFHRLPVRADIAHAMLNEGLTFLRYGGSMVNAPGYRWKKMIGARDRRPQYRGTWYPYSTNGFGIEQFVAFCRSAHIEPAFAINIEETPEDAADLVEYLNGPKTSAWGRRRAADGHPAPYRVRTIEIGNEETTNQHYIDRFKLVEAAMHARDPRLQLVIAAWWEPQNPFTRQMVKELNGKAALWDVHVGGDNPGDGPAVDALFSQMERLVQQWSPGTTLRACVFEENGGRHDMQRALGHARVLNATLRHGDFVRMDCPANCLQPWQQNDNGWDQGQIFFTSSQVWAMPPYYVQQMAARTYLPLRVASDVEPASSSETTLDVVATRSGDGRILALKVVNPGMEAQPARILLEGRGPVPNRGVSWTLTGFPGDVNTAAAPERVYPRRETLDGVGPEFHFTFPPYSYTVLWLDHGRPRPTAQRRAGR